MQRYLLNFAYIGTRYNGMTRNLNVENHVSIEGSLLDVVRKLKNVSFADIHTSSRTDAGVHALNSSVAIDVERYYGDPFKSHVITKLVNEKLSEWNEPIRVLKATKVPNDFNVRFNVISRSYLYRLAVAKNKSECGVKKKELKSRMFIPIEENQRCHFILNMNGFDIERAKVAAEMMEGIHDFRSFMKKSGEQKTLNAKFCIRKMESIRISAGRTIATSFNRDRTNGEYDFWDFHFKSRAYFYRQIRNMVGTLVAVADGSIKQRDVYEMLTIPSHHSWNYRVNPVPAYGLYLVNVEYPEEIYANNNSVTELANDNDENENAEQFTHKEIIIKN